MEFIRIPEMLAVMDMKGESGLPIPFSFTFTTCNLDKDTGGKRITYKAAVLVGGIRSNSTLRNPNHYKNYTRNFRAVDNDEIREFHPPLVEIFNGLRVTQ